MTAPSHPAVDRVIADLTRHGLHPDIVWLGGAVTTAPLAAAAIGVEVGQIANSLVFTLDDHPLLVLTSGAHRVDSAWLGEQLGGTIGRASKDVVKDATGQVIGGVAPVGHPSAIRSIVDQDLGRYDVVWAAAGHARTVFPTTFDQLLTITGGEARAVVPGD